MRDFTVTTYRSLLDSLQKAKVQFLTFEEFLKNPSSKNTVILRHDVDDRKYHSLEFAKIQHERGIRGTYFFRVIPQVYDEKVIREIYELGHEIGYHYEDMDFAKGNPQKALKLFEKHLKNLRDIVPINTICMHGSPRSQYDNKDIWKHYNYRDYDILGEPYFDLDFKKVFYLTDTGRMWNGSRVSIRDKVTKHFDLSFRSTHQIIDCLNAGRFPNQVMFNFHPQRWTDNNLLWIKEKQIQSLKNSVKSLVVRRQRTI